MKTTTTKKPRQKTQDELAAEYHVSQRTIRAWEKEGAPLNDDPGKMAEWIKARRSKFAADKPAMEALKMRRLELQCEILQREKDEAEGRLIRADRYELLMAEHLGSLRQAIRNLFLTELPSVLPGRSQSDIREMTKKMYDTLCRRMQNAAGKLSIPDRPAIQISPSAAATDL